MARCIKCNEVYSEFYLKDGVCEDCISGNNVQAQKKFEWEQLKQKEIKTETEKKFAEEQLKQEKINSIIITTETMIDLPIEKRITVISSQCIFGINIVKDLFSFVRDIVGGRVNSLEKALDDANKQILIELKQKTYDLDGNAVVGVKIEHTYNNANSGSILSVMATGTVVKLKLD